ncbi:MAG: MBL fold metallo-hydrolase, partial [Dehalococcoidia bacterium]|nr:MBL fold metallo-hydrolase [Dehalococcoidia bacterium]
MGDLSVQFLGSGDAFGSAGRLQTCIHLQAQDTSLLIDCGASAVIGMKRFGVDPASIATILISHLHGDHFGGLPFFMLDAQFSHRKVPLTIAGPPGVAERVRQAMDLLFPGSSTSRQRFEVRYVELPDAATTQMRSLSVTPYAVVHPSGAPAYALRVDVGG